MSYGPDATHLATALVQYLLPEGEYDNPTEAAITLLEAMPDYVDDVEAILASCQRCQQSLMGQAWQVSNSGPMCTSCVSSS